MPTKLDLDLVVLLSLTRRRDGGSGAPAELGLPQAPSARRAPVVRPVATHYAQA
jgi:hypothetical protein